MLAEYGDPCPVGWRDRGNHRPEDIKQIERIGEASRKGRPCEDAAPIREASSLSDLGPGFIIGLVELRRSK